MNSYTQGDVLRIAKRQNNTKRTYLLVNPIQAKHIPVSPTESLDMMMALGNKLAHAYPHCKLVIGFAETATAIGAAVASCFANDCIYIHTTRENLPDVNHWIMFLEEHSHAAEQKLCGDELSSWLAKTDQVIFVDDEISTGKTLINIVEQFRKEYPVLKGKEMIAASIINRVTEENEVKLRRAGIVSECLVKLPDEDYAEFVRPIHTRPATDLASYSLPAANFIEKTPGPPISNPRKGVVIRQYQSQCLALAESIEARLRWVFSTGGKILVLGTEECMYPALVLGKVLEQHSPNRVFCHATTRSPISISESENYPIWEGYKLHSFYDLDRETYIYDLAQYDAVVVVSDSEADCERPLNELSTALAKHECGKMFFVRG